MTDRTQNLNQIVSKIFLEIDSNRKHSESEQDDNSLKLKILIKGPFLGILVGYSIGLFVLIYEFLQKFKFNKTN